MRSRRGLTLLQTLFTLMVGGLISATVFQLLSSIMTAQSTTIALADAAAVGRTAIDNMADHLRNGSACADDTKGVYQSVLASGTATGFSYYSDSNTCATVTYALNSGNLVRTVGTTSTIVARWVTVGVISAPRRSADTDRSRLCQSRSHI